MGRLIPKSSDYYLFLMPMQFKRIRIPSSFVKNDDVKWVLRDIINDFQFEEKQAIYYSCASDATIEDVAKKIELSQNHVSSVLTLYLERLMCKIDFFKKIIPYDESDTLSISELLFLEPANSNDI